MVILPISSPIKHDPALWFLIQAILRSEVLLTDSTEQSRERPQDQKTQKDWYSGKKKQHTQKTQILGTSDGLEIVDVIEGVKGQMANINPFREQQPRLHPEQEFMGDKAYIGAERMTTPHKKPSDVPLKTTVRTFFESRAETRIPWLKSARLRRLKPSFCRCH